MNKKTAVIGAQAIALAAMSALYQDEPPMYRRPKLAEPVPTGIRDPESSKIEKARLKRERKAAKLMASVEGKV